MYIISVVCEKNINHKLTGLANLTRYISINCSRITISNN